MNKTKFQQGFTLIELMITIALLAIMAAIAMPGMSNFIASQRLANRTEQVATLFRFARTEAVRLNQPVVLCGGVTLRSDAKPNNSCDQAGGQSLLAFVDRNGDSDYQSSITNPNNDVDLRSVLMDRDNLNIQVLGLDLTVDNNTYNRYIFLPNGQFGIRRQGQTNYAFSQNYLRVSADDGERVRMVLIAPGGRTISCQTVLSSSEFSGLTAADYRNSCDF